MKFTDLTSAQRSMLTMLCTGQSFSTAELGRGTNPVYRPDQASASLLGMRDLGLVFSNQKPAGQQHAMWKASEYGRAVFAGRPDDIACLRPDVPKATKEEAGEWVLYMKCGEAGTFLAEFETEACALAYAGRISSGKGGTVHVAKLIARVKPVQQPTFEIERV